MSKAHQLIDKFYSRSMEDLIEGMHQGESLAFTLFKKRITQMGTYTGVEGSHSEPNLNFLRKEQDDKSFDAWLSQIKVKLSEPNCLSDNELRMLVISSTAQRHDRLHRRQDLLDRRVITKLSDEDIRAIDGEKSRRQHIAVLIEQEIAKRRNLCELILRIESNEEKLTTNTEAYLMDVLKEGYVEALYPLIILYQNTHQITNAAKCSVVFEQYDIALLLSDVVKPFHDMLYPLGILLQNHPNNPYVLFYAYLYIKISSIRFSLETLKSMQNQHEQAMLDELVQLADKSVRDSDSELSEFDKFLMETPWEEYRFELRATEPDDNEIEDDTIYLYPAKKNLDFYVACFSYRAGEAIPPNLEIMMQNDINFSGRIREGVPILITQSNNRDAILYGNSDGTLWKRTLLDSQAFFVEDQLDQHLLREEIIQKQAHTPMLAYAVKNQDGNVTRSTINTENRILGTNNFCNIAAALQDPSIKKLTQENKNCFLKAVEKLSSIPKERISPLCEARPQLQNIIYKRKLYSIARTEFDLEKTKLKNDVIEHISDYAVHIGSRERRTIQSIKEQLAGKRIEKESIKSLQNLSLLSKPKQENKEEVNKCTTLSPRPL